MNPCNSLPCHNGGQCIPGDDDNTYHCFCHRGYRGTHCEEDIDDCLEHMEKCLNGAVCEDLVNGFKCRCAPGFSGISCQLSKSSILTLNPSFAS